MNLQEKRKQKYPDTKTFHYYNANPKNKITTDCVIRALCTALEQDYNTTVMEMAKMQCETGYDDEDVKLIDKYLSSKGWTKYKQPRKYDNTKYTGKEFCEEIQTHRHWYSPNIVANIGGHHIVAIMFGQVNDIWNSTHKCIGNYWMKY